MRRTVEEGGRAHGLPNIVSYSPTEWLRAVSRVDAGSLRRPTLAGSFVERFPVSSAALSPTPPGRSPRPPRAGRFGDEATSSPVGGTPPLGSGAFAPASGRTRRAAG